MILYTMKCDDGHEFDSWFESAKAFDRLREAGLVTCSVCGSPGVEKAIMAPKVMAPKSPSSPPASKESQPLSGPVSPFEQKIQDLRKFVETNAENVGTRFAEEARAIHDGDAPERSIYGKAQPDEARSLAEDGIPVLPLPWFRERVN